MMLDNVQFYWLGVKCALSVRTACIYMIYKKGVCMHESLSVRVVL